MRFDRAFTARLVERASGQPPRGASALRGEAFKRLRAVLRASPAVHETPGKFELLRISDMQWVLVFAQTTGTKAEWYADVMVSIEPADGGVLLLDMSASVLYAGVKADFGFYADRVWRVMTQDLDRALDSVAEDESAQVRFERAI
jgi:hypothetical protein